jgi:hypothetical protein
MTFSPPFTRFSLITIVSLLEGDNDVRLVCSIDAVTAQIEGHSMVSVAAIIAARGSPSVDYSQDADPDKEGRSKCHAYQDTDEYESVTKPSSSP